MSKRKSAPSDRAGKVKKRADVVEEQSDMKIPVVGFGTYKLPKESVCDSVLAALAAGYRLIDTAQIYGNEKEVGQALKASSVPRDEVFVTSKVWRSSHGFERTTKSVEKSLRQLQLSYIDLVLVHWPGPKTGWPLKRGTVCPPDWTTDMRTSGTWAALEELVSKRKVRHLGVANYSERHLAELLRSCSVRPYVNQVEYHPLLVQDGLLAFCKENGVVLQGFASLGSGESKTGNEEVLALPPVVQASLAHAKTPAQVLLRWAVQKGVHVIPKTARAERLSENRDVFDFELTASQVAQIDACHANRRLTWKGVDPDTIP
ncbi:Prostaglandin F synthase [Diplonema papillatum]|nr:Prostaglandin F synthase [Diplonema papillatum]